MFFSSLKKTNRLQPDLLAKIKQLKCHGQIIMVNYNPLLNLPSSDELPDSDDKPVEHEIQILIPNLLRLILNLLWRDSSDCFFGVNMGIYHTTWLAKNHSTIVIEDLNVSGRLKNHKLASAIADCGFYEFKRQLSYKCEWYGSKLVIADRFYPSSQLCSHCGHQQKMPLHKRTYVSEALR